MDKKALSVKGMSQEVKDINDKKKMSDEVIGKGMPPIDESPDLTFKYDDARVHDDVYAVIKFSTNEMLSGEQGERVLTLYRNFVESFFNVKRADADDYKDTAADAAAKFVRGTEQEDVKKLSELKKSSGSDVDEDDDDEDKMRVSSARKGPKSEVKAEDEEMTAVDEDEDDDEEEREFSTVSQLAARSMPQKKPLVRRCTLSRNKSSTQTKPFTISFDCILTFMSA